MNLKVNLGIDEQGNNVDLDLGKENIHFTILVGSTGSGKSVFHYHLYKQLAENNSSEDLGFIFLDMTRTDFSGWESPFVIDRILDAEPALKKFEELGKQSNPTNKKAIFVHIEEMDMLSESATRFEDALENILKHKRDNNIYVVFSTSRPSVDVLTPKIRSLVDLKVVFNLASKFDSKFMLGNDSAATLFQNPGQRILVFGDKRISCKPFTAEEADEGDKYFWNSL